MSNAASSGSSILDRLAAVRISWGVCEVPGWGLQLPPDRVLSEMRSLGVLATEAGLRARLLGVPFSFSTSQSLGLQAASEHAISWLRPSPTRPEPPPKPWKTLPPQAEGRKA